MGFDSIFHHGIRMLLEDNQNSSKTCQATAIVMTTLIKANNMCKRASHIRIDIALKS
jgi:hypothetical protein